MCIFLVLFTSIQKNIKKPTCTAGQISKCLFRGMPDPFHPFSTSRLPQGWTFTKRRSHVLGAAKRESTQPTLK